MNYPEALEYLDSFTNYEKEKSFKYPEALNLDRMRRLAKEFGNPQNAYPSIIIAGSKGKGSVASILSSILRMENIKTGLYSSPHLVDVRERIQVNGLLISEVRFAEYISKIQKMLDEYSWRKDMPTYFEVLTAIAFAHFKDMKVQAAVLEVGLGGLYDSTNIAEAKVVGLTPIGLEHTDILGKTIAKIAVQKCGVIKGREAIVSSPQTGEAERVIVDAAERREGRLFWVGREIKYFERDYGDTFQKFDLRTPFGDYFDLSLHLLGQHQIENAAQAVALAKCFEEKTRLKISEAAIKQGIKDARWPGRLEMAPGRPPMILDGAHTRDSMRRMLEGLKRHFHFSRLVTVFGVLEDKDLPGIFEELLPDTSILIATEAGHPRSVPAEKIAEAAESSGKKVLVKKNPQEALVLALEQAAEDDVILVTGSLYLVALARTRGV